MWHGIILPLVSMAVAALICISTMQGKANLYSVMMKKIDVRTGRKLFFSLEYTMSHCDDCKAQKLARCIHAEERRPRWLDGEKVSVIKQIMGDDSEVTASRELDGEIADTIRPAFKADEIAHIFNSEKVITQEDLQLVTVTIDPNGGGGSFYAMSSVAWRSGEPWFIGAEALPLKENEDRRQVILGHLNELQQRYNIRHIIVVPENNLGSEYQNVRDWIRAAMDPRQRQLFGRARISMLTDDKGKEGIHTTDKTKERMATLTENMLSMATMRVHENFVCVGHKFAPHVVTHNALVTPVEWILSRFERELKGYNQISVPRQTIGSRMGIDFLNPLVKYSGKMGGQQDDCAIVFQLCVLAYAMIRENPRNMNQLRS